MGGDTGYKDNKEMELEEFKNTLYKERQIVDALATTAKTNMASLMAILAAIAIPLVPAIFSANGVYTQTAIWSNDWREWTAIATAVAIEGSGMFLSVLATKTYSAWRKKAATKNEIYAMAIAVGIYTVIVVSLIALSDVPLGLKVILSLIPLLGIAFYVGMGFETDLANRIDERDEERRQKRADRLSQKVSQGGVSKVSQGETEGVSKVSQSESVEQILKHFETNGETSLAHLARQLGMSRSTLYRRIDELETKGQLRKNGHSNV